MINPRPIKTAPPASDYVVAVDVQNLHIAGRKVAKGDILSLTAMQAAHWVSEGVLKPVKAVAAAPAPATPEAPTAGE